MAPPLSSIRPRTAAVLAPLALVDRDACSHVVQVDRALEEAPRRSHVAVRRQQEVHGLAESVNGPLQMLPLSAHLDAGLIHSPRGPDRSLAGAKHNRQNGQHLGGIVAIGAEVHDALFAQHVFVEREVA